MGNSMEKARDVISGAKGYALPAIAAGALAMAYAVGAEVQADDAAATSQAADLAGNIPQMVRDEQADDWVVDRFAGNSVAGPVLFQGPARETGGLGKNFSLAVAPDGRVFFLVSEGIAEVSTNGVLRLVVSKQEWRADGLDDMFARGGLLAWNPKEHALYFWGKSCIRRLVEKPDGTRAVETVLGNPKDPGVVDGPVAAAKLNTIGNILINSRGTLFFYDGKTQYGACLRKCEDGVVTTINDKMRSGKKVDGPLKDACFSYIGLGGLNSIGETDDILYIGDHWNTALRRIDLKTEQVTTIAGMPKPKEWHADKQTAHDKRFGRSSDGPALTHASANSGLIFAVYDPVHKTVWMGGPDEDRLRWVRDGWTRTILGAKRGKWNPDGMGTPADLASMCWCWVLAVDAQGRAYVLNGQSPTGLWRLYNKKEVTK